MKIGDVVEYSGVLYEISSLKSNSKGVWIQFSSDPSDEDVESVSGVMAECWFSSQSVKLQNQ